MTFAEEAFYRDFLAETLRVRGVEPIVPTPPPAGVELAERSGPHKRILFMLNYSGRVRTLVVPGGGRDIWNGEPCGEQVRLGPYASRVLLREAHANRGRIEQ
jgi:hypothetical protein